MAFARKRKIGPTRARLLGAAAMAALLASAGGALAQVAAEDQTAQVGELVVVAPNYVPTTDTSATKIAIPLIETPQSISVITRDQIDVLNLQNLQETVRYTSGVIGENFGPDERFDWITQRGFQPIEYIDGLQAPIGSVSNVGIDLWGADSVEILKGPSGVLYGQTPPGGLVNVTLRHPRDSFHGEVQGLYGSFDDKQIAGDITGPLTANGALEGRLTSLYFDRGTQTHLVKSTRFYIAPALTWNIDPDTHLTVLGYYQRDRVRNDGGGFLPAVGTVLPNPLGQIPISFDAGDTYNLFARTLFGVGYEFDHSFSNAITFKQNLMYSGSHDYSQSVYGAGLEADNRTLDRYNFVFPEKVDQLAIDSRLELRFATGPLRHTALAGFDYRDQRNASDLGFALGPTIDIFAPVYGLAIPVPPISPFLREDIRQAGLYGQDEMKLDRFILTVSAREDSLHTKNLGPMVTDDRAFTYRAGLNYVLPIGLAPYVAYSTSFLPTPGSDFFGKPFVPSTGSQIEGGIKFEPRHPPRDVKLFASAAIYDLDEQHVTTNDPNHAFFNVQTGEVRVKGVELEAVARIRERLSLNAAYTYTDSKVVKSNGTDLGQPVLTVPKNTAAFLADYTFQTGALAGFGAGFGVRYQGSSIGGYPSGNPATAAQEAIALNSPPETLFDAMVHYDFRHWRVAVNASNVFDKKYIQRCSSLSQCFFANRRRVELTVGRKW
ncbi:MAG: TonB-dependent siderophore receptor [Caulobacteraceae bacterium]